MVVMAPPLGKEGGNALLALQTLAEELADAGVATLRFDYAGTGDSAGHLDDPDRLTAWRDSIGQAVAQARRMTSSPVVLLGMRMGALLALDAVRHGVAVDRMVLWDPYASGREFLRIERTLLTTWYGVSQAGDGSVTGPAFRYSPVTTVELSGLSLDPDHLPCVEDTLVLVRRGGRRIAPPTDGPDALDWIEIDGQEELLDVPPQMLTVPATTLKTLVEWTAAHVGGAAGTVSFAPEESARVGSTTDGRPVCEHAVRLGPHALFGVVTEPAPAADGRDTTGPPTPTVVFLSAGALDHTGAGRMWVEMARRLGRSGVRCLRIDFDGIGETFGRPGQPRQVPKPPEAIDDLVDMSVALGDPDARTLVFVGLSSGGYHGLEAGLLLHPRAVVAVNPGITVGVPDGDTGVVDRRRRAYRSMPAVLHTLSIRHGRVATWLWQAVLQVWVSRSAFAPVAGVARRGVPLLVIVSEDDAHEFEPSVYWSAVRRRLHRRGLLEVEVVPGDDHSLYTMPGQNDAYPLVERWVRARCGVAAGD